MRVIDKALLRIRSLFVRRRVEDELDAEVRFHLQSQIEENIEAGMVAGEARRSALLDFGGEASVKEECRDERGLNLIDDFASDIRYAVRSLKSTPGFALAAILSLAVGIGANSAIFSVINAVVIRPLPFRDPDRLVMIWENNPQQDARDNPTSPLNFLAWQQNNRSFEGMGGFRFFPSNITGDADPERVWGSRTSARLFDLLGAKPILGRTFIPEEDAAGKGSVVILSHSLWVRRYSSDRAILGKAITLNNNSFTVVGVMGPNFQFPIKGMMPILSQTQVDLWVPLAFDTSQAQSGNRSYGVIGRLKAGVSIKQASDDIGTIAEAMQTQYPQFDRGWSVDLVPIKQQVTGKIRPTLLLLSVAAALVLLIACVNVANLLLARGAARQKEIGIRISMGAGRTRLIRQLLTESIVLSLTGGVLGLVLSAWCVKIILAISPDVIPLANELKVDSSVLVFSLMVSVVTGLLFGLLPAIESSQMDVTSTLKGAGRGRAAGLRRNRVGGILVVSEVALSFILLIGAGLLIKSFYVLQNVDPGFNPKNLLTMELDLSAPKYREPAARTAFFDTLLQRLRSTPGVVDAGSTTTLPFSTSEEENGFLIEGRQMEPGQFFVAPFRVVDPNFFETMGTQLREGRFFLPQDDRAGPPVIMVNETMARRYWPGESPIGKRIALTFDPTNWRSIVGVVADAKSADLTVEPNPELYVVYKQLSLPFTCLVVRTAPDPGTMVSTLRQQTLAVDSNQPVSNIKTMDEMISESVSRPRLREFLLEVFAGIGIVLAAIGLYGLMNYSVGQRFRDIAVRMALGAERRSVLRQILREGCLLAGLGIVIGLVAGLGLSYALTRAIPNLIYGVDAGDPMIFAGVSALLGCVAVVSCYFPARRATLIDPIVALRLE